MVKDEMLTAFSDWEAEEYDRQARLAGHRLSEAEEAMDAYFCHAQHHVLEVVRECGALLDSAWPWLEAAAPGMDRDWARDHLLVAAKLHDIRMGGSPSQEELLDTVDGFYRWMGESPEGKTLAEVRSWYERLARHAANAELDDARLWRIKSHSNYQVYDDNKWRQLRETLARYHDGIKNDVRQRHAAAGGALVWRWADLVRERYGEALDVRIIALLVALHSTSSTACQTLSAAAYGQGRETVAYIQRFAANYMASGDTSELVGEDLLRRIVALSTLLRLADTRRSGRELRTIDNTPVGYETEGNKSAVLYAQAGDDRREVPRQEGYDILLGQVCTDFCEMVFVPEEGGWTVEHRIEVRDWGNKEVFRAFAERRLYSYVTEINRALLRASEGVRNLFCLRFEGASPEDALWAAERLRAFWEQGDALSIQYAPGIIAVGEDWGRL